MLHLCYIFQFVIHRLYDCPFPEQQPVRNSHQRPFHVVPEFRNELYSIHEQMLKQLFADISLVPDQLSVDFGHEAFVLQRLPVIDITWCDAEVEDLALLIADDVQLETEEPAHRALSPGGYTFEDLVYMYPLIPAHAQGCAVHKVDARTLATKNLLDKQSQWKCRLLLQFHETVI